MLRVPLVLLLHGLAHLNVLTRPQVRREGFAVEVSWDVVLVEASLLGQASPAAKVHSGVLECAKVLRGTLLLDLFAEAPVAVEVQARLTRDPICASQPVKAHAAVLHVLLCLLLLLRPRSGQPQLLLTQPRQLRLLPLKLPPQLLGKHSLGPPSVLLALKPHQLSSLPRLLLRLPAVCLLRVSKPPQHRHHRRDPLAVLCQALKRKAPHLLKASLKPCSSPWVRDDLLLILHILRVKV
mmetsp:Transcript_18143/g.44537  ORF Transcript_18143/g.44537 Transcript_18143/m.44537 type:complete len:238 (-) Transcript_18143:1336-2049(-)